MQGQLAAKTTMAANSTTSTNNKKKGSKRQQAKAQAKAQAAAAAGGNDRKIPVTVLTGFLGSGKTVRACVCGHGMARCIPTRPNTPLRACPKGRAGWLDPWVSLFLLPFHPFPIQTLLNHILTSTQHGKRIAVIENEYGEVCGCVQQRITRQWLSAYCLSLVGKGERGTERVPPLPAPTEPTAHCRHHTPHTHPTHPPQQVGVDDAIVNKSNKAFGEEDVIEMNNGCICCTVRGDLIRILTSLLERKGPTFDAILIETTGLADPAPVAQTFFVHEELQVRKGRERGGCMCMYALISMPLVSTCSLTAIYTHPLSSQRPSSAWTRS